MSSKRYGGGVVLAGAVLFVCTTAFSDSGLVDAMVFGDAASEQEHGLEAEFSEIFEGALDTPARRFLPKDDPYWRGGNATFEMAVDPDKPNYVTAKFWGGYHDPSNKTCRLMIFINEWQIGQRHLGEIEQLDIASDKPRFGGRFFYKTIPLPVELTEGKRSVELAIEAQGHLNGYAGEFNKFQSPVEIPSRGIYRLYTHTRPFFVPDPEEVQGPPQAAPPIRDKDDEYIMEEVKARVNKTLTHLMERTDGKYGHDQLSFMARAYHEPWTVVYQSDELVEKVVQGVDYQCQRYNRNEIKFNGSKWWSGIGLTADAVRLLKKEMKPYFTRRIDGKYLRNKVWAKAFADCRDERVQARRSYTNQSMILDTFGIYLCNRAVAAVGSPKAWSEKEALEILYESVGIEPWSGSRRSANGKPEYPNGKDHYIFTPSGLSRELGYVGAYGEVTDWACKLYDATRPAYGEEGDAKIKAQLAKIAKARAPFRYPGIDDDGNRAMRLENIIGWRDWKFPGGIVYDQVSSRESIPFEAAVYTMDRELVGYAQHMLEENQYFMALAKIMKDQRMQATAVLLGAPHAYEVIKKLPDQPARLPMAPGQPDFVFADPMNGVVALKNGEEILYTSLYWRARYAVNFLARVHHLTPTVERDATVWEEVRYTDSGKTFEVPDVLNAPFNRKFEGDYRDGGLGMSLAETGIRQPIAEVPDDFENYEPGKENIYAGKGNLYLLRYGNYFIAMNCTQQEPYQIDVPADFVGARDLVSGQVCNIDNVKVSPEQTIVLYRSN